MPNLTFNFLKHVVKSNFTSVRRQEKALLLPLWALHTRRSVRAIPLTKRVIISRARLKHSPRRWAQCGPQPAAVSPDRPPLRLWNRLMGRHCSKGHLAELRSSLANDVIMRGCVGQRLTESIQDSIQYNATIVAKQLYRKLCVYKIFKYCRNLIYLLYIIMYNIYIYIYTFG